jgi:hypothetical protein
MGEQDIASGVFEVKSAPQERLSITIGACPRLQRLTGALVNADGQPAAGKYVLFRAVKPTMDQAYPAKTDETGKFTAALRPGQYRMWTVSDIPDNFWDGTDAPTSQLVTVLEGENPPLRVGLPPSTN